MIVCSKCAKENPDYATRCLDCGKRLGAGAVVESEAPGPAVPAAIVCRKCGKENPGYATRCLDCGKPIGASAARATFYLGAAWLAMLLVLAPFVLFGIGLWQWMHHAPSELWYRASGGVMVLAIPAGVVAALGGRILKRGGLLAVGLTAIVVPLLCLAAAGWSVYAGYRADAERQALRGQYKTEKILPEENDTGRLLSFEYPADWVNRAKPGTGVLRTFADVAGQRVEVLELIVRRVADGGDAFDFVEQMQDVKFSSRLFKNAPNLRVEKIALPPFRCILVEYDEPPAEKPSAKPAEDVPAHFWSYVIALDRYSVATIQFTRVGDWPGDGAAEWAELRRHVIRSLQKK